MYPRGKQAEYMRQRARERHAEAVEQLGGHCAHCGVEEPELAGQIFDKLEVHHGAAKNGEFRNSRDWSRARFEAELAQPGLLLLCRPCHMKLHGAHWGYGYETKPQSGSHIEPLTEEELDELIQPLR
jgi:hypothetical protein